MAEGRRHQPEWIQDHRRHRRWVDKRTALLQIGDEEHLAKTADISVGGLRLTLHRIQPQPGAEVKVTVVFPQRLQDFYGTVVYHRPEPWGCFVGVEFDEDRNPTAEYLREHYPARADAAMLA